MNFSSIFYKNTNRNTGILKYSRRKKSPPLLTCLLLRTSRRKLSIENTKFARLLFRVFFNKRMLKAINKTDQWKGEQVGLNPFMILPLQSYWNCWGRPLLGRSVDYFPTRGEDLCPLRYYVLAPRIFRSSYGPPVLKRLQIKKSATIIRVPAVQPHSMPPHEQNSRRGIRQLCHT